MDSAAGDPALADLRLEFDRRLKLEFHGSKITPMPDCSPSADWTMRSAWWGDGHQAPINCQFLAHAVFSTDEAVERMR